MVLPRRELDSPRGKRSVTFRDAKRERYGCDHSFLQSAWVLARKRRGPITLRCCEFAVVHFALDKFAQHLRIGTAVVCRNAHSKPLERCRALLRDGSSSLQDSRPNARVTPPTGPAKSICYKLPYD